MKFALALLTTAGMVAVMSGQDAIPLQPGFSLVTDWSHRHLMYSAADGIHTYTSPPTWNTTIGGLTTEVTGLQWRNGGPQGSHALAASGGTSGIIMDNAVGSGVLAGTSEVYFSPLSTGACGAGNGCAVQASQSGLN